ncbi:imidazole glycerol phosphate synthase subunit HisH 1 [Acidimicrobiaceae bacterium]|nr:imidazole glycerol phosphate synthase subunit HisH 1 [Acidimicrobiaceae bacterium]
MISVIDYGAGNLRSVTNVLELLNVDFKLIKDAESIRTATKIILPGVGHFGQLSSALDELKIRDSLREQIESGVPYLGICLGMQILFENSCEAPQAIGLGLMAGSVMKFEKSERIPHMGWNTLDEVKQSRLIESALVNSSVSNANTYCELFAYYAHSYFCPVVAQTVFTTTYGDQFSAVIESNNIFGVQFHPEKSGDFGRLVMQNFASL